MRVQVLNGSGEGGIGSRVASYLRQGISNITLAALFAPKPLAMSGAAIRHHRLKRLRF